MRLFITLALIATMCRAAPPASTFEAAEQAASNRDYRKALALFHDAATTDSDPERRALALARAGNIEWRVDHDLEAARRTFANATEALPLVERARAEEQLAHDYVAARQYAQRALAASKKREQRRAAIMVDAEAALTPIRNARLAGKCVAADSLAPVVTTLEQLVDKDGPRVNIDRMLLECAILTNNRESMLRAWRWYYGGVPALPEDRRGLGEALANAKFFDEAALVLANPCAPEKIDDADVREIVDYAAATRRIRDIANEHYRHVALHDENVREFRANVEREHRPNAEKRFRAVVNGGKTGGVDDLHYGHAVVDSNYKVEQYGRTAQLHFIALDGIVSNGYMMWALDGNGGDGGWNANEGIYQIRPMYADDPIGDWLTVSDPEIRATKLEQIEKESKRDETRDPLSAPRGCAMRMRLQADDALVASLKAKGLSGDALRVAFIDRVRSDVFASSILAHEGRHALDHREGKFTSPELEFRAKLSEVAFAPDPRRAITSGIFVDLDTASAHGKANRRIFEGLMSWMRTHANEIQELDTSKPLLPQFDKLTNAQIRDAVRSMDPFAQAKTKKAARLERPFQFDGGDSYFAAAVVAVLIVPFTGTVTTGLTLSFV